MFYACRSCHSIARQPEDTFRPEVTLVKASSSIQKQSWYEPTYHQWRGDMGAEVTVIIHYLVKLRTRIPCFSPCSEALQLPVFCTLSQTLACTNVPGALLKHCLTISYHHILSRYSCAMCSITGDFSSGGSTLLSQKAVTEPCQPV